MASRLRKLIITAMCMLLGAVLLAGCGTIHKKSDNPRDPYEHRNRQVYRFNRGLDDMILRPAASFAISLSGATTGSVGPVAQRPQAHRG